MSNILITVTDDQITDKLANIERQLATPRKMMDLIAITLRNETLQTFSDEGYPNKWTPLKRATLRDRRRKGYPESPILQRSRKLLRSFVASSGMDYAMISSDSPYAAIHHHGGVIKRKGFVRLRSTAKGLMRQQDYPNLARFASLKHKRAVTRQVDYEINIPARPIIPVENDKLTPRLKDNILKLVNTTLLKIN